MGLGTGKKDVRGQSTRGHQLEGHRAKLVNLAGAEKTDGTKGTILSPPILGEPGPMMNWSPHGRFYVEKRTLDEGAQDHQGFRVSASCKDGGRLCLQFRC